MTTLTLALKSEARTLGFDYCRITPVAEAPHRDFFYSWLQQGRAGEMGYLSRHAEKRRHPQQLVEEALPPPRSLVVLGVNHYQFELPESVRNDPSRGLIASYAWGDDYHSVIRPRLFELDHFLRRQSGRATPGKALVDTGPVLERDWAQQAGIGFTGKNCCTIHPTDGSWLLLATLLVPEILDYDLPPLAVQSTAAPPRAVAAGLPSAALYGTWQFAPDETGRSLVGTCGRCTRCLDACPTNAFVGPYHLDPQRCISYWTIEARSAIPQELRPHFGNRIFGCDICQEVCPWNRRLPTRMPLLAGLTAQVGRVAPPLLEGFEPATPYWLDETAFRHRFRNSPILRAKRRGMLRNVCVALGNWADQTTIPALAQALADSEAQGRAHAAWALGQVLHRHDDVRAKVVLTGALAAEGEPLVRAEIEQALKL